MAFVDVKQTIWQRFFITDEQLEDFMKLDEKEKYKITYDLVDQSSENEWLYDTSETITPAENNNCATVEVYKNWNDAASWDNLPQEIKRDMRINKILK